MGRTFKFGKAVTTSSKAFGSTRAFVRTANLMRSLVARYDALDSPSEVDDATKGERREAQSQSRSELAHIADMPDTANRFYQAFREEALRIRQPILSELYQAAPQR